MQGKSWAAAAALVLTACGGGVLAIVSFVGSAGGDWQFDQPAVAGFQTRNDCGVQQNENCVVNIQRKDLRNDFSPDFDVRYTGNLPGCPPNVERTDGTVRGERIVLPGCFSGRYVTINEVVADDGVQRAFFDSEVPDLRNGVWVDIHGSGRRFKFNSLANGIFGGCELTPPPRPAVTVTLQLADLSVPILQTTITSFNVTGQTWSGVFVGLSGMRLTRSNEVLELERRNLPDVCT